jgi:hypothetical protein
MGIDRPGQYSDGGILIEADVNPLTNNHYTSRYMSSKPSLEDASFWSYIANTKIEDGYYGAVFTQKA